MTKVIHIGDIRSGAKCDNDSTKDILVHMSELKQTVVYYESTDPAVEAIKIKFNMQDKSICTECFPERFVNITEFQ